MGIKCKLTGHKWKCVQVNTEFSTQWTDQNDRIENHTVCAFICEGCETRKFTADLGGRSSPHPSVNAAKHRWVNLGILPSGEKYVPAKVVALEIVNNETSPPKKSWWSDIKVEFK